MECKNFKEENIEQITKKKVDKLVVKYHKLAEEYPEKEIRPLYISKNGFSKTSEKYLQEKGIPTSF